MTRTITFEDEDGYHIPGGLCPWCDDQDEVEDCDRDGCPGQVHNAFLGNDWCEYDEDWCVPIFDLRCDVCGFETDHDEEQ